MAASLLTQFLTSPAKVASALDWKKTSGCVLALKIGRDSVSLNLAQHPSRDEDCHSFEPISIKYRVRSNRKVLDDSVTHVFQGIVKENNICGFVVDWPLQKEGRMGASCGRVLHILDSLLETQVLSQSRKFCLWDGEHVAIETEDKWGRCPLYGRKCDKTEHIASRDQDTNTTTNLVADMWHDFSRAHWPELCARKKGEALTPSPIKATIYHNAGEWLEHYEREGTYLQASSTMYDRRMIATVESAK